MLIAKCRAWLFNREQLWAQLERGAIRCRAIYQSAREVSVTLSAFVAASCVVPPCLDVGLVGARQYVDRLAYICERVTRGDRVARSGRVRPRSGRVTEVLLARGLAWTRAYSSAWAVCDTVRSVKRALRGLERSISLTNFCGKNKFYI